VVQDASEIDQLDGVRPGVAVIALDRDHGPDESSLSVIRELKDKHQRIIAHGDNLFSWPIGLRCNALLNGAMLLLDSSTKTFNADLRSALIKLLQNEKDRQLEELEIKQQMAQLGIVGTSGQMLSVFRSVIRFGTLSDFPVLISGETGTGKELIARAIHKKSSRGNRAFVSVNCASIPTSLIAAELFGHEKGAFTGALQRRIGRFEAADGGTIFLDEIGDLLLETQVTLLRVLQEREIERVGSSTPIPVDVRVIAATNRDLEAAVESGAFRQDLYYRLNVVPILNPPLRDRVEDIPVLVEFLVARYAMRMRKTIRAVEKRTIKLLQSYEWPGNVRELQNVVERAVVLCEGDTFSIEESWLRGTTAQSSTRVTRSAVTLAEGEKKLIENALKESLGKVSGPGGAASKLGIPRQTLESKLKLLKIDRASFRTR